MQFPWGDVGEGTKPPAPLRGMSKTVEVSNFVSSYPTSSTVCPERWGEVTNPQDRSGGCRIMMRLELQWGCFSQGLYYTPRGPRPRRTNKLCASSFLLYYYYSPPLSTLIFLLSFILFML